MISDSFEYNALHGELFNKGMRLRSFIRDTEKQRAEIVSEIEYAESLGNSWLSEQYSIALDDLDDALCDAYEALGRTVVEAERLDE